MKRRFRLSRRDIVRIFALAMAVIGSFPWAPAYDYSIPVFWSQSSITGKLSGLQIIAAIMFVYPFIEKYYEHKKNGAQ